MGDVRYLPIEEKVAAKYQLLAGDILVSRGNGTKSLVGLASLVTDVPYQTISPDTAFRIRLNSRKANPEWLALIWNAPQVRVQIENVAKTTAGIWKISQADLNQIRLIVPCLEEQTKVARHINAALDITEKTSSDLSLTRVLVSKLDQAILAKAYNGELAA